jgi:hypothetical protein
MTEGGEPLAKLGYGHLWLRGRTFSQIRIGDEFILLGDPEG